MGFVDTLRKATGAFLNPAEQYDRAWEKGVLLGPGKYGDAASLFEAALRKAVDAQDGGVAARARANAALYGWIASGDPAKLHELHGALEGLQDIEAIGSRTEVIPSAPLKTELEARLVEAQLATVPEDAHAPRIQLHQQAADAFKRIFSSPLYTYRFHATDPHVQGAQARFFLHQGLLSWHSACNAVAADPDAAAEHAARALASFRQCNDERWSRAAEAWLGKLRTRRTCWMCHRELQGLEAHVHTYPAIVTPYLVAAVTKLGQDVSSLDPGAGQIVLCTPCGTAVEAQADRYAKLRTQELRAEVEPQLARFAAEIGELWSAVRQLQSRSHSH